MIKISQILQKMPEMTNFGSKTTKFGQNMAFFPKLAQITTFVFCCVMLEHLANSSAKIKLSYHIQLSFNK